MFLKKICFYKKKSTFVKLFKEDIMRNTLNIRITKAVLTTILFSLLLMTPVLIGENHKEISEIDCLEEIELDYIEYHDLYKKIAHIESRQRYDVANKTKTVGKYQASRSALLEFGYSEEQVQAIYDSFDTTYTQKGYARYSFDLETFPPEDQEEFIRWYMQRMETVYLKQIIDKYVGTRVNNVYITRAGILNASMLGFNHVMRFLESDGKINYTPRKGYSIQNRLEQFDRTEILS